MHYIEDIYILVNSKSLRKVNLTITNLVRVQRNAQLVIVAIIIFSPFKLHFVNIFSSNRSGLSWLVLETLKRGDPQKICVLHYKHFIFYIKFTYLNWLKVIYHHTSWLQKISNPFDQEQCNLIVQFEGVAINVFSCVRSIWRSDYIVTSSCVK